MDSTKPPSRPRKDDCMVSIWPRTINCDPRGSLARAFVDDAVDIGGHAAQIAILHVAENIDGALDVVVRNHRHLAPAGWC